MKYIFALLALLYCCDEAASAQPACSGTGADYSVNAATIPSSGFVLLQTVPVTCYRSSIEVQNQSAGTIQIVRDDGNGNNQSTVLLAPGSAANTQGGSWGSQTFKGRVRIYGASGAQVAVFQE